MEASTTVKHMLQGNKISVPSYQRAYSWETEIDSGKPAKQTNLFLSDLEDYRKSSSKSPYYFGHFLFEDKQKNHFSVIDGQQRLTTIVIFLSALFSKLKSIRPLTEYEQECLEDIIKRNSTYCEYDEEFKQQYVDCLGNYLLLSKSHNCSVGNSPFINKRNSYIHLAQQREIQEMTLNVCLWSKEEINKRKAKIIDFILKTF